MMSMLLFFAACRKDPVFKKRQICELYENKE